MKLFILIKNLWSVILNFKLFNLKIRFFDNGIITLFGKTITLNTKQGIYKIYTRDKAIGRSLFLFDSFEEGFLTCFKNFIENQPLLLKKKPFFLLDIGANIGVSTIALERLGLINQSLAIEPDADNFELLKFNIQKNNLQEKVTCLQIGVSNEKGQFFLDKDSINYGHHTIRKNNISDKSNIQNYSHTVPVQTDTLPNLIRQSKIDLSGRTILLWIDIEGHEGFFLEGAKDWIKAHQIICVMEIFPDAITSSGMELDKFTNLVKSIWTHFYILRHGKFIKKPINLFDYVIIELEGVNREENIIFVNEKNEFA